MSRMDIPEPAIESAQAQEFQKLIVQAEHWQIHKKVQEELQLNPPAKLDSIREWYQVCLSRIQKHRKRPRVGYKITQETQRLRRQIITEQEKKKKEASSRLEVLELSRLQHQARSHQQLMKRVTMRIDGSDRNSFDWNRFSGAEQQRLIRMLSRSSNTQRNFREHGRQYLKRAYRVQASPVQILAQDQLQVINQKTLMELDKSVLGLETRITSHFKSEVEQMKRINHIPSKQNKLAIIQELVRQAHMKSLSMEQGRNDRQLLLQESLKDYLQVLEQNQRLKQDAEAQNLELFRLQARCTQMQQIVLNRSLYNNLSQPQTKYTTEQDTSIGDVRSLVTIIKDKLDLEYVIHTLQTNILTVSQHKRGLEQQCQLLSEELQLYKRRASFNEGGQIDFLQGQNIYQEVKQYIDQMQSLQLSQQGFQGLVEEGVQLVSLDLQEYLESDARVLSQEYNSQDRLVMLRGLLETQRGKYKMMMERLQDSKKKNPSRSRKPTHKTDQLNKDGQRPRKYQKQ